MECFLISSLPFVLQDSRIVVVSSCTTSGDQTEVYFRYIVNDIDYFTLPSTRKTSSNHLGRLRFTSSTMWLMFVGSDMLTLVTRLSGYILNVPYEAPSFPTSESQMANVFLLFRISYEYSSTKRTLHMYVLTLP